MARPGTEWLSEFDRERGRSDSRAGVERLRSRGENRAVIDLARDLDRTLVSGGDRHGREPNAIINLTNAATFAEFADEVRSGSSHVLFLPQYREPLALRILKSMCDVLRDSQDLVGRERWTYRV